MGDLLRQGGQWLEQMRTAHCSSPVAYHRGDEDLIVNATFGRTEYEVEDQYGLRIGAQVMDFLILADDLTFGEPQPGDQITTDGRRYEVLALGADSRGWRWSDPYRQTYRIHTRDIGAAT